MRNYYSMETKGDEASISIYGDITSYPWKEGDTSAKNLSQKLEELGDVSKIRVYLNSYGGEVAEGLAIYNALKRHKAKVVTVCDGFACSIASVIFMAGDERIMNDASLLMIHNAWTWGEGNADQLRKMADDLDKITKASIAAYKANSNLSEEEIKALLDAETWLLPSEALEYGFATGIETTETKNASQSARGNLFALVMKHRQAAEDDEDAEDDPDAPKNDPEEPEKDDPEQEPEGDPEGDPAPEKDDEGNPDDEDPDKDPDDEANDASQCWAGFFEKLKNI